MPGRLATSSSLTQYSQLLALELGDLLTLPDGRDLTVRAMERKLAVPTGSMFGFVLGGEIGPQATLASLPSGPDGPVYLYTPLDDVPASARNVQMTCEGAVSYWAPHLPNMSGALGELSYRVFKVRGQIEPMVLIWRGAERVVFVQSGVTTAAELAFLHMNRNPDETEVDVTRHAARVTNPSNVPSTPAVAPARKLRPLVRR